MNVEVIIAEPPMMAAIDRVFHTRGRAIVYTFGTRIYNPAGVKVHQSIMAHEAEHSGRQTGWTGVNDDAAIERWWTQYLEDPAFRLAEEIPAHQAEYRCLTNLSRDRNRRAQYLNHVADKLAAPLYGNIISRREALRQIQGARA